MIKIGRRTKAAALIEGIDRRSVFSFSSILLSYPSPWQKELEPDLKKSLSAFNPGSVKDNLETFFHYWLETSEYELEQNYVDHFDLAKKSSLYLTWYSYGDKRDRGQALVALKQQYRQAGFELEEELPDFLPAILELAAHSCEEAGIALLEEHRTGIELLRLSLINQSCPHAALLEAICLCLKPLGESTSKRISYLIAQGPPNEAVGLEPFGPPELLK